MKKLFKFKLKSRLAMLFSLALFLFISLVAIFAALLGGPILLALLIITTIYHLISRSIKL